MKKKYRAITSWSPKSLSSKGANAYHTAVVDTSWHKDNIDYLIQIIRNKINTKERIVDFGAGTGASSVYLLPILPKDSSLYLVDNSASWLTKAYEIMQSNNQVGFHLLEKKNSDYMQLSEIFGDSSIDHVISANTFHLISNITSTCIGIYNTLKKDGTFTFQSGNILPVKKENDRLMIDDSIDKIHDLAINMINSDSNYVEYRQGLNKQILEEAAQRKFVFPAPRPVTYYTNILKEVGFKNITVARIPIKVTYKDWLDFLQVRRLQAGILPEIGGRDPTEKEEHDRNILITKAAKKLFSQLKKQNPLANPTSFTAEWTYIYSEK